MEARRESRETPDSMKIVERERRSERQLNRTWSSELGPSRQSGQTVTRSSSWERESAERYWSQLPSPAFIHRKQIRTRDQRDSST